MSAAQLPQIPQLPEECTAEVLKVGEIAPLRAILKGKWAKK